MIHAKIQIQVVHQGFVNVDSTGCEIIPESDEDNDGVADTADLCNNTPS